VERGKEGGRRLDRQHPEERLAARDELGAPGIAGLAVMNVEDELDDLDPVDGAAFGKIVEAGDEGAVAAGNDDTFGETLIGLELGVLEAFLVLAPHPRGKALAAQRLADRLGLGEARRLRRSSVGDERHGKRRKELYPHQAILARQSYR